MVTESNCTAANLKRIFDSAGLECIIDERGNAVVKNNFLKTTVLGNGGVIRMANRWIVSETVSRADSLKTVNKVNLAMHLPKAFLTTQGPNLVLAIEYYVRVDDGISPATLVDAVKLYESNVFMAYLVFESILN